MPPRPRRDTTRYFPTVWPTMPSWCSFWGTKSLPDPRPDPVLTCGSRMAVLLTQRDLRAALPGEGARRFFVGGAGAGAPPRRRRRRPRILRRDARISRRAPRTRDEARVGL